MYIIWCRYLFVISVHLFFFTVGNHRFVVSAEYNTRLVLHKSCLWMWENLMEISVFPQKPTKDTLNAELCSFHKKSIHWGAVNLQNLMKSIAFSMKLSHMYPRVEMVKWCIPWEFPFVFPLLFITVTERFDISSFGNKYDNTNYDNHHPL